MVVQDDRRETEMRNLFGLEELDGAGRGGTDAILRLSGESVPDDLRGTIVHFELKSTTKGSVTTVRDFGPDHLEKWRTRHWLVGFYDPRGERLQHSCYGSPAAMSPWIEEKAEYVRRDFELASMAPEYLTLGDLYALMGKAESYSIEQAKLLQKKQLSAAAYLERADLENAYSPEAMLGLLRERCAYLIRRGSTLNNPHISPSYFADFEKITEKHSERLLELVVGAYGSGAARV